MASTSTSTPDVAIVGSGPAGLSLAAILEQRGISYVVYEKYSRDSVPLGSCLDMHAGSGQEAFKQGGCYDAFRKVGRAGPVTIHQVWDHHGNKAFAWGEDSDSPEIDRFDIKMTLLTVVPDHKVVWGKGVVKAERDGEGKAVLHLSDGSVAKGFKLVVGADGAWSKVRALITDTNPVHSGVTLLTGIISRDNPYYAKLLAKAGPAPMVIMGKALHMWVQMQGDGHFRVDLGAVRGVDWPTTAGFDVNDAESVKRVMLTDEYFGEHHEDFKETIKATEGPFRLWPLFRMPPEKINWAPSADVTLIGDAAHTTVPFVGEGANCAMRDAVVLARCLTEMGIGKEAVAAYEADMQPYAIDVIQRSDLSGEWFFDADAPASFAQRMSATPLIKNVAIGKH